MGRLSKVGNKISQKAKAVAEKATSRKRSQQEITPDEYLQRTQEKAFQLFERRGFGEGNDWFDWCLAQDIVRLECDANKRKRSQESLSGEELQQATERKAYELFERKGYQQGTDMFNWIIAEEMVRLENGSNGK